jgi:hypothetical protein
LAPTGEIEATLLAPDGQPQGGVVVELVDRAGNVLLQTTSDFDGYVLFDSVPYGEYRLRLAEKSAKAIGARDQIGAPLELGQKNPSLRLGRVRLEATREPEPRGQSP